MPAFSSDEMAQIMARARIAYPTMTDHDLEGLNQLYDYAVYEKNMPAFELGVGASTGWGKTFSYMVEMSGLPRQAVSAYLVAMREFMDGTIPADSWLDRMQAGVDAILQAPADAVNLALNPLIKEGSAVKKIVTPLFWLLGGVAVVFAVTVGSKFSKGKAA